MLFIGVFCGFYSVNFGFFSRENVELSTIVEPTLGVVAGIGAVSYLVIAYRKQKNTESAIVDQRMVTAIEQLASGSPQKRIAGVYALAEISDTYRGEYKQRVVDILCGYLRTDRHGDRTEKFIERLERLERKLSGEHFAENNHGRLVSPDAAVESTNFRVMRERLLRNRASSNKDLNDSNKDLKGIQVKDSEELWCDCTFDLHGAVLVEKVNLSQVSFDRYVNFDGAYFVAGGDFTQALFSDDARFRRSRLGKAEFGWASFDQASFIYSSFGEASFDGARFGAVSFDAAVFGGAIFKAAKFDWAHFNSTRFCYACFDEASFAEASFDGASFDGVRFAEASFVEASFVRASFQKPPYLDRIVFRHGKIPKELDEYLTEDQKRYATDPDNWPSEAES